jgi:outer membrane protein assembly factor BamB
VIALALGPVASDPLIAEDASKSASLSVAVGSDHWPGWRGPSGLGVARAGDYPVRFSDEHAMAWKVPLPGLGTSTPVVWGDAIVLTCGVEGRNTVCRYDFDGKLQWQRELGPEVPGKHRNGSGANSSPVTDGERVVVYFKSGELAALDLDGRILWQRNLQEQYGKDTLWWDLGTSPVLVGERVIVAVMQEGDSYLVAVDVASGKTLWKQSRTYERPRESDQAYTTPQLISVGDRPALAVWGADHLTLHDVETGQLIRQFDGFNPNNQGMWRVIASAAVADNVAVVPYGRASFLAAVRLDLPESAGARARLWTKEGLGADVPTPVIHEGRVYLLGDQGRLTCLALQTGEEIWAHSLPRGRGKYYASPLLAGDLLYATREDGVIFVGRVGESYEALAENELGESLLATPVPVRDGLIIRGSEHLFRVATP